MNFGAPVFPVNSESGGARVPSGFMMPAPVSVGDVTHRDDIV